MKLAVSAQLTLILSLGVAYPLQALPEVPSQPANGKALAWVKAGERSESQGDEQAACAAYRKALRFDPGNLEANVRYIDLVVTSKKKKELEKMDDYYKTASEKQVTLVGLRYWQLAVANPASAGLHFAKALETNPKLAPFLRQRFEHAQDAGSMAACAEGLAILDPRPYHLNLKMVLERFPDAAEAPAITMWFAEGCETQDERQGVLLGLIERLKDSNPSVRKWATLELFRSYAQTDGNRALALARKEVADKPQDERWRKALAFQESVEKGRDLLLRSRFDDAAAVFDALYGGLGIEANDLFPWGLNDGAGFRVLRARAHAGAGHGEASYADLLQATLKSFDARLVDGLLEVGATLGKGNAQVWDDLLKALAPATADFKPFTLNGFDGRTVDLGTYRGKVVLVNFWYPNCSPCRSEFALLREMVASQGADPLPVLAINAFVDQDPLVMPIFQQQEYPFIPLRMPDPEWAKREYHVVGAPTNFLIGPDGKVVAQPIIGSRDQMKALVRLVEALRARALA